jgi:polar amino acid transport system substrate-binding protein
VNAPGRRASSAAAKVAAVLAAALMVSACAGAATTVRGTAVRPVHAAAVRPVHAAAADVSQATATTAQPSTPTAPPSTCNPKASSLRPSGPPSVPAGSFMARIRARGYLIAGVDQSTYHFGFLNPLNGQIEGFDIDMIHAVAKAIFGDPNKVVFKAITDAQRVPDVENGTVDIVAHTMTITCARLQQVDFSSVYFDAGQRVLVLKDNPATSLGALKGQKVCATSGSDSLSVIGQAGATPVAVAYWTDCLVLLQQGDVAGISTDDAILYGLAAQDPFTKVIGPRLTDEPYGLAISRQHPDFVRFVNAVLAQLRANGSWAASYAHWVGTPVPAPPAALYSS